MRAPGYTLIELTVAAAILAIVAAAALPLAAPVGTHKLDAAAQEVVNALRFARGEAIRTGSYYGVDFSVDPGTGYRRVRVFRTDGAAPPNPLYDVRNPLDKKLYDIQLVAAPGTAGALVSAATFYFRQIALPANIVVMDRAAFDPAGTPVYYPDPANYAAYSAAPSISAATVSYGGQDRQVLLDPVTGRVTAP
ncbi:MAG: GspH/FimT family protein [Burkholderiales bacterium]|jgi:prepilin-type N-terminal cleavage/methylation domain-containing protein